MWWPWRRNGGRPQGSAKMSVKDSNSASRRSRGADRVLQHGAMLPMPVHRTMCPLHQKDIVRLSKSHKMDPKVRNHWMPKTMSSPQISMSVARQTPPLATFTSYSQIQ
jgi:hypothetical protein